MRPAGLRAELLEHLCLRQQLVLHWLAQLLELRVKFVSKSDFPRHGRSCSERHMLSKSLDSLAICGIRWARPIPRCPRLGHFSNTCSRCRPRFLMAAMSAGSAMLIFSTLAMMSLLTVGIDCRNSYRWSPSLPPYLASMGS